MSLDRDPFPFPKYENDNTFTGTKPRQRPSFKEPSHIAQTQEPWSRLHDKQTSSSMRRNVLFYNKDAPKDSLDFHLSAVYNNHVDFLVNKNETLLQRESLMTACGGNNDAPKHEDYDMKLRVWIDPQKASIYNNEGAIESHHNASTNRGYSRKHDGGFYST